MADSERKGHLFSARRLRLVCVLCLVLAPLVSALGNGSDQFTVIKSTSLISEVPRGGGDNNRNNEEDSDDEERTRFWSLSALFRMNANAKDDATSSTSSSTSPHLQRGNKRGGALAVRTSKSKTFVDVTPVSTASSRMMADDAQSDLNDYEDDTVEPLEAVFEEDYPEDDSETLDVEETEEDVDATEEEEEIEEESDEETPSTAEQYMDATPVSTATSRLVEEDVEEGIQQVDAAEIAPEEQDSDTEEMTGSEILQKMREERDQDIAEEKEPNVEESPETEGILQDATKYWWNNVWTEQIAEGTPELEELVSDESDADITSPGAAEAIVEEKGDKMQIIDAEVVHIQEVELVETQDQEPSIPDEAPSELYMHREKVETSEDGGLASSYTADERIKLAPEERFEEEKSHTFIPETAVQVERHEKEESLFISSGYVRAFSVLCSCCIVILL